MNKETINAVAEAMHRAEKNRDAEPAYWTTECTGSHVYLNMAKAAIEAYETAQRSDKEACHSKSADSESQNVREMTVHEIQTILAKDMSKEAPEMEDYWHDVVEDGVRELAKLGTIRITGGGE